MSTKQIKDRKIIMNLVKAIKSRECVDDPNNQFYGEIDYHLDSTSDFYHESYHDEARKEDSKYRLDQVRKKSIGSNNYKQKYQSIQSIGIDEEVVSVKNFDPHSHFEADTLDGNSRIIISEDVEAADTDGNTKVDVPHFIITNKKLGDIVRRKKKFFQNKMNDHLPHSGSEPEEIKEYIREEIAAASNPEAKPFKTALIDEVHEMVCNSKTRSTVSGWVTEIYNERKQQNAGIVCWKPQAKRWRLVRKLLEQSRIPDIKNNWCETTGLEHSVYTIHSKSTIGGNIEKDLGTIIVNKEYHNETKPAINIFFTTARSKESLYDAQLKAFKKLEAVEKKYNFYDYTFTIGQVKGQTSGTLLTKADVENNIKKLEEENSKVVELRAVNIK
jgi:hypothetical protein